MWSLSPPHLTSLPPFPPQVGKNAEKSAGVAILYSEQEVHSTRAVAHLTSVWGTLGRSGKRRTAETEKERGFAVADQ